MEPEDYQNTVLQELATLNKRLGCLCVMAFFLFVVAFPCFLWLLVNLIYFMDFLNKMVAS